MNIDELFKTPKLPARGSKKRMPDNPTPEMLKKMRTDVSNPIPSTPPEPMPPPHPVEGMSRAVTIEDMDDQEEAPASRDFAPGGDADYFAEEDEEGRFFGGGLTTEQKEILSIFEGAGREGVEEDLETLSTAGIRRILLRFERAVNKNQDQRSKYPDDPSKFIDSEADLDSATKALLTLAQVPLLAYPELVKSGAMARLVGLLTHENVDIVIDVVEVLHELTDEDVGNEAEGDNDQESNVEALRLLIEGLLENSVLELLVDNLARLNESEESDRQGVFHVLGIFENILGFNPQLSIQLVLKTTIMNWLLERIQSKKHDENRGYTAELLSILLQDNKANRLELGKHNGIEILLTVLSQFRRRDPVDADETEFMENVFDTLCSSLSEPSNKDLFLASEGVDLMVLMMKEKLQSCTRAVKTLDYAMSGQSGTDSCESFVEALGLKTLFSIFMGKGMKKKTPTTPASEDTSHVLGIIASLFSNLASDSPARVRLLAKFVEGNYEKVDKLLEIRESASTRLAITDRRIEADKQRLSEAEKEVTVEEEYDWYLERLNNGLFTLQNADYILAWIVMEDDGIRGHAIQMLNRKSKSLKDVASILQIYHDNLEDAAIGAESAMEVAAQVSERAPSQRVILQRLIMYLEGC